jgi:hypothetical protein
MLEKREVVVYMFHFQKKGRLMKPKIFSGYLSSAFYAALLSVALPLSAEEAKSVEIHLSAVELQEIFNNPKRSYVYVGEEVSAIAKLIAELAKLDENPASLVHGLNEHIAKGFNIGNYDAVAQALEEAEQLLIKNADLLGEEKTEELANSLNDVIEQVIDEKLNLDSELLSFLKDSVMQEDDATKGCCKPKPHCHGLRLLVVKEKVDFQGKVKFREDVRFKDDVVFEDDVTFQDNVVIEGSLSVADQVIGCDLTVGCNINMNNSTDATVGNILKGGAIFMNNFGSNSTFLGTNAGNALITGIDNTGLGFNALSVDSTGAGNTAVGARAMQLNEVGSANTAVGVDSLQNNAGDNNTAVGFSTLTSNTTGARNTAMGRGALNQNIIGSDNTAIGDSTLVTNVADDNTAVGSAALNNNTFGINNTAVGSQALGANTLGSGNVGLGAAALQANNGTQNTAVGFGALTANVSGNFNTAIGQNAGAFVTTGSNNIYVANLGANESNTIRIGTIASQTRCFIQGISGVTTAFAAVPVLVDGLGQLGTISSSASVKHDIADMGSASDNIMDLRPVTFVYNGDETNQTRYGLIAEEVDTVFPALVAKDPQGNIYSVHYETLPVLLLNELQKLAARVAALEAMQQ